jgi:ankyrin repeat protein
VVERLLRHDPGLLDLPGTSEKSALMAAAEYGHPEIVRSLLARGASPRLQRSDGARALDWAAQNGHSRVVEVLLEHDRELPSVTSIVAGEPISGSWWGHPLGHAIYDLLGGDARYKQSLATDESRLVWGRVQKRRPQFALEDLARAWLDR